MESEESSELGGQAVEAAEHGRRKMVIHIIYAHIYYIYGKIHVLGIQLGAR